MKKIILIMFVFLFYNITFAELSLKEQSYYTNQIEQFFNKYDSKISKLTYDEKIQFYDKILKQSNIILSKTKNEKKVYILTKLIQTTQNKKNSTIIAKQKSQIKTNENKVVQNYINSYTGTIVSNIDFGGKSSHKDQITANDNSDTPQNVDDFYLPNGELIYKNKEIFDKYYNYYFQFYPTTLSSYESYKTSLWNYEKPKYYNLNIKNFSGNNDKQIIVKQYKFGSKYEFEQFIMTTALPWIKYTKGYDARVTKLGRDMTIIEIAIAYSSSKSNPLSTEDLTKLDTYYKLIPDYSILY